MIDQFAFVIYFIYGLAFFGMGIAMALESGRSPALAEARVLWPLSAFGLIHGTHEWMESYILQAQSLGTQLPLWFPWLRLVLLVSSFSSLMLFGYFLLKLTLPRSESRRFVHYVSYVLYIGAILLSVYLSYRSASIPWLNLMDGLSRYLLAVPACLMATIALQARARTSREMAKKDLAKNLTLTAAGFAVYTLTQLFVHPLEMFPARFLNEATFLIVSGFPIQVIRSITAVVITIGLVRSTFNMEDERRVQFYTAQQSRLEALQQQEALRRELLAHTVRAQEDERARIARELHDETAQELSAFSLELAALRSMLKRQKAASAKVEHLQNISRRVSQGLYRLVHDLRPAQLDDLGLVAALRYFIGHYHADNNIDVRFSVDGDVRRLDPSLETVLFRVAQEGLTNIARHAGTCEADVQLVFEADLIHLIVADQGQGFDANGRFPEPRGWGLVGMRERVESVGGDFRLTSARGSGTQIEVIIPLKIK
jgi:signal transduction histidine kinase